ncbi:MAG TPA: delta-60 repeat domain-containing protein [Thermoleophilaceae bacterium]|nr:delta-60 repeat domain-containing protein [Thermoleophilaceae bacterium]
MTVGTARGRADSRTLRRWVLAAAMGLLATAPAAWAAPGDLDPFFDGDGRLTSGFGTGTHDQARAVAVQADGKIVAAGNGGSLNDQDFAVARYNPDGSPDTTFDGDGSVLTGFGKGETANDVAIQADGKIVVAGYSTAGQNGDEDFAVARYHADGELDSSFSGDGKELTNVTQCCSPPANDHDRGEDVAIQADGKIVVGGWGHLVFEVVRYEPDGDLDLTFDGDGKQTLAFGPDELQTRASGLAIEPDGNIVQAGWSQGPNGTNFAVARYKTDGAPDDSFSGDGRRTTDIAGGGELASDVAVQPNGRIVVAGNTVPAGESQSRFALAAHTPEGVLDVSFAGDGTQVFDFGGSSFGGGRLAVQLDGKLLQAGGANDDFALARLTPDGALDATFSGDGKLTTDFGGGEFARGVAIQADGKVVLAGSGGLGGDSDFALARYLGVSEPSPGGGGGQLTGPQRTELALRYAGARVVRVSRTGRFALGLQGPAGAAASIALRTARAFRSPVGKAQRRRRPLRLGSRRFTFPASGRVRVRFRLSRRNLKLLRRARRLRTRGVATAGAQRARFGFTLKAPRRLR